MHRTLRWPLSLALACGVLACGDEPARTATAAASARERDARLAPLVRAIEGGRSEEALAGLAALGAAPDADPVALVELEARARFLAGDAVGALRAIETVRREHPLDGRLWASEAELYAAMGRPNAGEEAYRKGLSAAGTTPELERAHGVLRLVMPGGARRALEALEHARELDPTLPFVDIPLSQAHLLLGRAELGEAPAQALLHARAGLLLTAEQPDLLELYAEAAEALGSFEEALEAHATLAQRGRSSDERRALLHKKAATAALVGGQREQALEHFRAARALGLDDQALGFGVAALAEAAALEVERGCALLDAGQEEPAEEAFAQALALDPESLEARHFLGVARFRRARYVEAALAWEDCLTHARAAQLVLPDPVHLDAARAWRLAGHPERARAALEQYLAAQPAGFFADDTREMLTRLDE